jgi:tape measure domain-containing protein
MALKLSNALSNFGRYEFVDLDCGEFSIKIKQCASHNAQVKAEISRIALRSKKTSIVSSPTSLTGSEEGDIEFFIKFIIVGWGEKPLKDDDGVEVPCTPENLKEIFTSSQEGRILFDKIKIASMDDAMFAVSDTALLSRPRPALCKLQLQLGLGLLKVRGFYRVSVVTKSQDELKVVMGKVYDIAQRSRSGLQETGDLYTRIALSSKSLGISQNEALQMTESVNKAIILSGASTQEASAGMIQFGQALASGRLRGDELRSIMEQLPMVADIIARHLGVTRGELWALGHQGKITSLDLVEAFRDAREEIEERFGKFVPTLAQGFIAMRNAIIMTLGKFNEFGKIAQGFFKISTFIAKHTDEIARAALGATMAFGVFAGARGIGAVINALRALTVLLYANPLTIIGVAAIVAAGQLVAFSDQILVSAGSLITLQDFGIAAFQFMMDGIKAFIQYFNDNFGFIGDYAKETFGEFDSSILGALQLAGKAVDGLIGLFVGSYRAIVKAFDDLPAALELIFVKAFNAIAKAVASGINFLIDGINKVTALADMDPIQHVVPNVIEATNKAKNHGKAIGEAFIEGFMEPSFATDALADIMDRAGVISAERIKREAEEAERLKNAEGLLGESGPPNIPNPGDKDKGPESFEDVIKGIQVENELLALNRKETTHILVGLRMA